MSIYSSYTSAQISALNGTQIGQITAEDLISWTYAPVPTMKKGLTWESMYEHFYLLLDSKTDWTGGHSKTDWPATYGEFVIVVTQNWSPQLAMYLRGTYQTAWDNYSASWPTYERTQLSGLTATQSIDANVFSGLTAEHLSRFSPSQLSALTKQQTSRLLPAEAVKINQNAAFKAMFSAGGLEGLALVVAAPIASNYARYSVSQISAMTDVQAAELTAADLMSWTYAESTPVIRDGLTGEQYFVEWASARGYTGTVNQLPPGEDRLLRSNFAKYTADWAKYNAAQLQRLSTDNVSLLKVEIFSEFTAEQLFRFVPSQLQALTKGQLSRLSKTEAVRINTTLTWKARLGSAGLEGLAIAAAERVRTTSRYSSYTASQISAMSSTDVGQLTPADLVDWTYAPLPTIIENLSFEGMYQYFSRPNSTWPTTYSDFAAKVISSDGNGRIYYEGTYGKAWQAYLTSWLNYNLSQLRGLSAVQISQLSILTVSTLTIPELFRFNIIQLKGITAEQLSELHKSTVNSITTQQRDLLSAAARVGLEDLNLANISAADIEKLSVNRISRILLSSLTDLSPAAFSRFTPLQ